MNSLKATAVAHPNIALVKYWGKRDEHLILPHQSSLSLTLAPLEVTTTVQFGVVYEEYELNGKRAEGSEKARIRQVLDALRVGRELGPAKVVSKGNFPVAAGLASSAAGFAALAVAARGAAGLPFQAQEASELARLGSGSACRSIQGGVCVWQKGTRADGKDSFATQAFNEDFWPSLRLLVAVVNRQEKKVKSRDGMRHTVETSPLYAAWAVQAENDVQTMKAFLSERNLAEVGELAEENALAMHATAMSARPPLVYFEPATLKVLQRLWEEREKGLRAWLTIDAGPNPVILCEDTDEETVASFLKEAGAMEVIRCRVGKDARLVQTHLF